MALRLLPREEVFFDLFDQTAGNALAAARRLQELLDNYHDVDRGADEIKALEESGDELTHAIIDRLNRTFVVPLDREDIFALAKQLDDVLDWIEASWRIWPTGSIVTPSPGCSPWLLTPLRSSSGRSLTRPWRRRPISASTWRTCSRASGPRTCDPDPPRPDPGPAAGPGR